MKGVCPKCFGEVYDQVNLDIENIIDSVDEVRWVLPSNIFYSSEII